ncbi:hypothetical protein PCAR4_140149 [Paraburkholderia caribensis]|nr:hypothetical protein PCAR4_140149 [Paraburkholderia caribensis]
MHPAGCPKHRWCVDPGFRPLLRLNTPRSTPLRHPPGIVIPGSGMTVVGPGIPIVGLVTGIHGLEGASALHYHFSGTARISSAFESGLHVFTHHFRAAAHSRCR